MCAECEAIRRELREAPWAGLRLEREDLAAWVGRLDLEEAARMREHSPLWQVWRRMRAHQALTGHYVPLVALPPEGKLNSN